MVHIGVKWIFFGVIISAVPIIYSCFNAFVLKGVPWDLELVIGNGEVFIMTAALCAGGLGELIESGENQRTWKILSGGACVLLLLVSASSFAGLAEGSSFDRAAVVVSSLWIYGAAVISTGMSVLLAAA